MNPPFYMKVGTKWMGIGTEPSLVNQIKNRKMSESVNRCSFHYHQDSLRRLLHKGASDSQLQSFIVFPSIIGSNMWSQLWLWIEIAFLYFGYPWKSPIEHPILLSMNSVYFSLQPQLLLYLSREFNEKIETIPAIILVSSLSRINFSDTIWPENWAKKTFNCKNSDFL